MPPPNVLSFLRRPVAAQHSPESTILTVPKIHCRYKKIFSSKHDRPHNFRPHVPACPPDNSGERGSFVRTEGRPMRGARSNPPEQRGFRKHTPYRAPRSGAGSRDQWWGETPPPSKMPQKESTWKTTSTWGKPVVPGSEFIYGASVVEAALHAGKRKFYRLYVYAGENRDEDNVKHDQKLLNQARDMGIEAFWEKDIRKMDSMSQSRPHNGYVLECSPIVKTPILSLGPVPGPGEPTALNLAQHDPDQKDVVISELPPILRSRTGGRYPLILMLDSVLDPGNLGAILRSAYYLGCSALLLTGRNTAPISPVALKAAAGAAEYLPVLTFLNPERMIEQSTENGWKFFAAVPPVTKNQHRRDRYCTIDDEEVKTALTKAPTVLVVGGEGEGLRETVRRVCTRCVSIQKTSDTAPEVDSLNVSVATALLCRAFLASGASPKE